MTTSTPINTLVSLADWNAAAIKREWRNERHVNVPNGIACPSCGKECVDENRSVMLMTKPPQYNITCLSCGFKGSRFI